MAIRVVKKKPDGDTTFRALEIGEWFECNIDSGGIFLKISEETEDNCIGFLDEFPSGDLCTVGLNALVTCRGDITISVGEK